MKTTAVQYNSWHTGWHCVNARRVTDGEGTGGASRQSWRAISNRRRKASCNFMPDIDGTGSGSSLDSIVHIFESSHLEGSYVGALLYFGNRNIWYSFFNGRTNIRFDRQTQDFQSCTITMHVLVTTMLPVESPAQILNCAIHKKICYYLLH